MTRLALLSDIHGNRVALEAVLDDLDRHGVDEIVCLGDVATLGPEPAAVVETLAARCERLVLGNHEEFVLDANTVGRYTDVPVIIDSIDWCRSQLDAHHLGYLATARPFHRLEVDGTEVLLFHGSPSSNTVDLLASTPPDELDVLLGDGTATVLVGGHTHLQLLRQHRGRLLVNPGSIGMPFECYVGGRQPTIMAHAEYAVLEVDRGRVEVRLQRVPLDRSCLRRALDAAVTLPLGEALHAAYA